MPRFLRLLCPTVIAAGLLTAHAAAAPAPAPIEIQVPAGFEVVRIAASPLIDYPVMGNFDERGRLFVAENAGVNLNDKALDEQTPNRVRMLEDTDGDGIFDRSRVFADQMTFPQGALWHQGGLYVASPPSIWRLEDTDGDGQADVRKILATGYKYTGNAADVHGPFLHPNGRIYWCHGRKGHEVKQADGTLVAKGLAARIWSMRPDGSDIQVHGSGGMDNPAEVTFNQEGDIFGTVNIYHRGPRSDAILHWIHGAAHPHHEGAIAELKRTGPLLPPAALIGHVAPSGTTLVRNEAWPADYRGNLFWAEFNTRRIMRATLEPAGSTFRARAEVFATTAADGTHFTDVLEDADGSLIVFDTGAWFRQGCPTSGAARPEIRGGIYRIRATGTKPVSDPRGHRIPWATASATDLVNLLGDHRPAVRDRALDEVARRGDGAVPSLRTALGDQRYFVRSNAVWALTRLATPAARAAARTALGHDDARVRQAAGQSAFYTDDGEAFAALVSRLTDVAPPVRREAARALGRIRNPGAVEPLVNAAAGAADDVVLSHAYVYALLEIDDPAATRRQLRHPHPLARRAALLTLDQLPQGDLAAEPVFEALKSTDAALRVTALQIAGKRGHWSAEAERHLAWLFRKEPTPDRDEVGGELLAKFLPSAGVRDWLRANSAVVPRRLVLDAIAATATAWDDAWREWLLTDLRSPDAAIAQAALRAITVHRERDFSAALREVARDAARPMPFRVAALQTAAGTDRTLDAEGFAMVIEPFVTGGSLDTRVQSANLIANTKLTKQQLMKVADVIPAAGPLELSSLVSAFQRGPADPEIGAVLLARLTDAPARFSLTSAVLQPVFNRYPSGTEKVAPLVGELLGLAAAKAVRVTELEKTVATGDVTRGQKAFAAGAGACVSCHRAGEVGTKVGPDLSRIGRIREVRDLVESITFPDSTIAQGYEAFKVETRAGETVVGTIARDTPEQVIVATMDGKERAIPRATVGKVEPLANSLMPSGLDRAIDGQTFADLVAYLKSLQ